MPSGGIMEEGFSTTITYADDADVQMQVVTLTPPPLSGQGAIEITTMENTAWETMYPKKLKSLQPMSLTVAYDPAVFDEIVTMLNANQLITITFPDGATWQFWGFIDEFTPGAQEKGERPTADMTIIPTLVDDSSEPFVETAPVFTAAPP